MTEETREHRQKRLQGKLCPQCHDNDLVSKIINGADPKENKQRASAMGILLGLPLNIIATTGKVIILPAWLVFKLIKRDAVAHVSVEPAEYQHNELDGCDELVKGRRLVIKIFFTLSIGTTIAFYAKTQGHPEAWNLLSNGVKTIWSTIQ